MSFHPNVDDTLVIDKVGHRFTEHPMAKGIPYGQEGRAGVVYQLEASAGSKKALKVFRDRFRQPSLVKLAEELAPYASYPGMQVCRRTVLTPGRHSELLKQNPDLTYAMLMPWIQGPTWMELLLGRESLTSDQTLTIAISFLEALVGLEQHGAAHCDLSGPNIIVSAMEHGEQREALFPVALVDVEQLYSPGISRPSVFTSGSSGYAHRTASRGIWHADADRFAGAVIVAEMLGWCEKKVREAAWGESFFGPDELQKSCQRYTILTKILESRWGENVSKLFVRAWESDTLADCPTFGEWLVALPPMNVPVGEAFAAKPVHPYSWIRLPETDELAGPLIQHETSSTRSSEGSLPAPSIQRENQADILAPLFDEATEAHRFGEWAKAKELLSEIVRRNPGYQRNGVRAQSLLEDAQNHSKGPLSVWVGVAVAAGAVGAIIILAGLVFLVVTIIHPAPQPTSRPTTVISTRSVSTHAVANTLPPNLPTSIPGLYIPIPGCASSHLHVGDSVFVGYGAGHNAIRSSADTHPSDNIIGYAEEGDVLTVIGGPECNYDWILWEVRDVHGVKGWTPESDGSSFWLTPIATWKACSGASDSRLHEGDRAIVSFDPDEFNYVHSKPGLSTPRDGKIDPGEPIEIQSGPKCADNMVWWNIKSLKTGLKGWTSEGDNSRYWLVPIVASP